MKYDPEKLKVKEIVCMIRGEHDNPEGCAVGVLAEFYPLEPIDHDGVLKYSASWMFDTFKHFELCESVGCTCKCHN